MARNTRIAVSKQELERFKDIKETIFPEMHDEIPHGRALTRLCEKFEERQEIIGERAALDGDQR
ncbi:hypothetical protein [Haloarcula sediminis]|uniref:hypothetical protein n=1 Tax=Haloarcula sediminis TaxID=3111777 RepID=UPI002D76A91A|nr:hypothetical protein [Haloarcula sp. CK38]